MIVFSREILAAIKAQAQAEMPNEACGYLAGEVLADGETRVAAIRIPMTNVDASPEHFSFDAAEQFAALKQAREAGLRLVATYHSHPETPARMSDEDIRLANDPDTIYLIYSLATDNIKGFTIDREKNVETYPVEVRN